MSAEPHRTGGRETAQASVEFVALLPVLAAVMTIAAQAVVAGWALWSAGNAARAGARAAVVGSDTESAARRALPGVLRDGAVIKDADGVRVQVRIPGLVPGIELPTIAAASRLDESSG